jgi:ABC-type amino acid transport substrate-binding protein
VCLEANSAPFSSERGPNHGLDHDVAARVAELLQRPLAVHWYSASEEEEFPAPLQANWLLSRGICHLIGGYPLVQDGLGEAPMAELRRSEPGGPAVGVRLSTLAASLPYLSLPLTLISAVGGPPVAGLDEVVGLRLAVERGSLADAIAMVYGGARLRDRLQRLPFDDDAIFRVLEKRAADYAFIEEHRFEIYRARVPTTRLRESGYRHVLRVNTGFVGIAPALLDEVDRALQKLTARGRIAAIVEASGLRYTAPGKPAVLPPITPRLLARRVADPPP